MKTKETQWGFSYSAPRPYIPSIVKTEYFDLTPTWSSLMPTLIYAAANGNIDAKNQLMRLAQTVDRVNASNKKQS